MTDNVKFIVEADGKTAEATLDGLVDSIDRATNSTRKLTEAQKAVSRSSDAYAKLGIRSNKDIQREIAATNAAYRRLAASGNLSQDELARAQTAAKAKVAALGKELKGTTDTGIRGFSTLAKTVISTAAAVGAFRAAEKLVEVARSFDVINASLITVTGTQATADKAFAQIQQFAATTPFSLEQVSNAFVKLKALGLDPSERALTSYGNTASAMGKDLNQMIEAVADASTGEFERLKEFGIKASQHGDRVSFTFRGMTTTVAKESGAIQEYLLKIGETDFAGAMERRADSLDGALSNLGDSWDNLFLTVSKAGVGKLMTEGARDASGMLSELGEWIQSNTLLFGQFADGVANAARGVALPFQIVGDALGGVAAQIAFIVEGDFAKARDAGNAAFDSMKQHLDAATDPKTATKYADIARRIIAENKKIIESSTGEDKKDKKDKAEKTLTPAELEALAKARKMAERELRIQEQKYAMLSEMSGTFFLDDEARAMRENDIKVERINAQFQSLMENTALSHAEREQLEIDHLNALAVIDEEYTATRHNLQLQNLRDFYQSSMDLQSSFSAALSSDQQVNLDNLAQQLMTFAATVQKIDKSTWDGRLQVMRGALTIASGLMDSENRKQFEIGKAAAIANAIVSTYQAADAALAIPYVGWALAAAVVAAGLANVQKIASTQFGSKSASGAGGNVSPGAVGAPRAPIPVTPAPPQQVAGGSAAMINVTVTALDPSTVTARDMQRIGDTLAPYLRQSFSNGQSFTVTV